MKTQVELFICNHHRDEKENCADKGAAELTDKLKKWSKENYKGEIKVIRSGCLGKCSEGIAMLCYPDKNLFLEVNAGDAEEIKEGLKETLRKLKD